ncbi:hypothetical protein ACFLTR_03330 [Chloroflexota bacterium]
MSYQRTKRHFIALLWEWLADHIKGIIIAGFIISFAELFNRWDIGNPIFIYFKISEAMDWLWQIDMIFTSIALASWGWKIFIKFINKLSKL